MKITGYEAYLLFQALKLHFTQMRYDFFKYGGKTKANEHSFETKRDRYWYEHAAKHYTREELIDLIVSNLLIGRKWFVDMVRNEAESSEETRKAYVKRKESFTYLFEQDLDILVSKVEHPKQLFTIQQGTYPVLINMLLDRTVPIETLAALDKIINYIPNFDRKLGIDDIIWGSKRLLIKKYQPFLKMDEERVREVVKQKMLHKE